MEGCKKKKSERTLGGGRGRKHTGNGKKNGKEEKLGIFSIP